MVTGFRPFDGRGINGAETVARALHGSVIDSCRIESRLINVIWRDVTRFCEQALPEINVRFVLALGEASRPWPTFESVGVPLADGADVSGAAPPICKDQSERHSRLNFDPEWFSDLEHAPRHSTDAGEYLCNWMLYNGVEHARVPLGFLHLPVQDDLPDETYVAAYLPVVTRLIQKNIQV